MTSQSDPKLPQTSNDDMIGRLLFQKGKTDDSDTSTSQANRDQKQICLQNELNWTPNAPRLRAMRRRFFQNLEDASTYKSIDLSGTRLLKYLDGKMGLDPFTRKDTLYLNFHLVPPNFSHRDLEKDLARFLEFFETNKTLPFNVITHPGQQVLERRLIKIGAETYRI